MEESEDGYLEIPQIASPRILQSYKMIEFGVLVMPFAIQLMLFQLIHSCNQPFAFS